MAKCQTCVNDQEFCLSISRQIFEKKKCVLETTILLALDYRLAHFRLLIFFFFKTGSPVQLGSHSVLLPTPP